MKHRALVCATRCVALIVVASLFGCSVQVEESVAVESVDTLPQPREAHLIFVGDVMCHEPQVTAAKEGYERYDFSGQFDGVRDLFAEADYVVGNLETTLSPRPPYYGYPAFRSPERLAQDMSEVGFRAVSFANNHTIDRGYTGILNTVAALDNAGIKHVGARVPAYHQGQTKPLVVEVEGYRLALLAYTYGCNAPIPENIEVGLLDTTTMRRHINMVRDDVDYIFALVHWGVEYQRKPNVEQRRLAEWMRRAGVDFVMGSHPHVVQPYEEWRDENGAVEGGVFYSMGNFISNQRYAYTDFGLVAHIHLRDLTPEGEEIKIWADTVRRLRTLDGDKFRYALRVE